MIDYQPSEYRHYFDLAFPPDTPYTTGFELRHMAINPVPPPTLDIILVTGAKTASAKAICERFAQDFHFCHIDVDEYLRSLADQGDDARPALGVLHPSALKQMLEAGKDVPTFFLLPILRYQIDREVERSGQTRFIISGLEEDAETAMKLAQKIAEPAALFSFVKSLSDGISHNSDQLVSDVRASIEECYVDITLRVEIAEDETVDAGYARLFATVSREACASSELKPRN